MWFQQVSVWIIRIWIWIWIQIWKLCLSAWYGGYYRIQNLILNQNQNQNQGECHHDATLGHKCKSNSDIEPCFLWVEEMLADEEIVDHVQHMGYEEMDVEIIESDDDGVDIGPS